jgi:hypothetical protein
MALVRLKALARTVTPPALKVRMLPVVPLVALLPVRLNVAGGQAGGHGTEQVEERVVVTLLPDEVGTLTDTGLIVNPPVPVLPS